MIKILFHIDILTGGGAEKVLCTLVNNMDKTKFDITVQTLFPCNGEALLNDGVKYRYCYPKNNLLYRTIYRIEAAIGSMYTVHMKNDYDIEVAYLECGPTKVIASSTNRKAKKVAWVHCDISKAFDSNFIKKTKKYYKKYHKVVCVSNVCRESFINSFGSDITVDVVKNVVDDSEIITKSSLLTVEKKRFTICTVGRLSIPKNYIRLLKAVKRLTEEGLEFDTWIVGEGELREEIEDYIEKEKLSEKVSLLGFKENPYPYMKSADLLVCSSSYEGYSTFIAEGVILGKPILTTNCSGMEELLEDYESGTIVANNDDAFYAGLRKAIMNPMRPIEENRSRLNSAISENENFFSSLIKDSSR